MVEAVKITNDLVAKNNEAFARHNAIFDIHIQLIKDLKEHQKGIKSDLHRRFDTMEDRLETHHGNALIIGKGQDELVTALRNIYGIGSHTQEEAVETEEASALNDPAFDIDPTDPEY